ncbi:hypothetical protein E2C01_031309 [Portunus trituberculatus]|uniref:Uncharacterized protein n=1 Tax=Portunus trituberculatus TaxID=210409 RepID=A0A5B7EX96_PORTR|nr:hypothetical protein [Portunus trituberculatus]
MVAVGATRTSRRLQEATRVRLNPLCPSLQPLPAPCQSAAKHRQSLSCDGTMVWWGWGVSGRVVWPVGVAQGQGAVLRPKPGSEDGVSLGQQDAPRILIIC